MKILKAAFILLFALMLIGGIALLVQKEPEAPTDGFFTYTVTDGKVTIKGCDETVSGELIVPSVLGMYPVTTIGSYAFEGCSNITSITFPNSVTEIQMYAFESCTNLESIHIPDSVTTIDKDAFSNCPSLTGIWIDANNPIYASDASGVLFYKDMATLICAPMALADPYTIPDTVKTIGDRAFYGCTNLKNIVIPDGIVGIDWYTFSHCTSLETITLPSSLQSIGYKVFDGCNSLQKVNYKGTEDDWKALEIKSGNNYLTNASVEYSFCVHVFDSGIVTKPVTCKEDGVCTYKCTLCERIKLETIPKLTAHTWDEGRITKAPTCKDFGTHTYTCTICSTTKTENISKLETHTWGSGITTKEPTCKEAGIMTYTCRYCGETKEDAISPLTTHTPGPPATSTTDQVCTVCGQILTPATGEPEPTEPPTESTVPTEPTEPSTGNDPGNNGGFFGAIADFFNSIGTFFEDIFSSFFSLLGF